MDHFRISMILVVIAIVIIMNLAPLAQIQPSSVTVPTTPVSTPNPLHPTLDANNNKIHDIIEAEALHDRYNIIIRFDHQPTNNEIAELNQLLNQSVTKYENFPWIGAYQVSKTMITQLAQRADIELIEGVDAPFYTVSAPLDVATRAVAVRASNIYSPNTAEDVGLTGNGINICLVDSGVDDDIHESLRGSFVAGFNTITNVVENPDDDYFHGTYVAGILLGRGDPNQQNRGVAPQAGLIDVKVYDANGGSTVADIIQGIDYCITQRNNLNIRIILPSVQSDPAAFVSTGQDAMAIAVNRSVNAGLVAVVPAGNFGTTFNTISTPGSADNAITVGNLDTQGTISRNDDTVSPTSGKGLRADDGDAEFIDEFKPEISAPGVGITAPTFDTANGYSVAGGTTGGTSASTPIVAGMAALILQSDPSLTPDQVRATLLNSVQEQGNIFDISSHPTYDRLFGQGEAVFNPALLNLPNLPGPSAGLTTTLLSADNIELRWNTPSNPGSTPITGYQIERRDGNGPWTVIVSNTGVANTSFNDRNQGGNSVPLLRSWNPGSGDHFYTIDSAEHNISITQSGYIDEGSEGFVFSTQEPNTVPLLRSLSSLTGDHFYTIDQAEHNRALNVFAYIDEGSEGFVFSTQEPNTVPLLRSWSPGSGDHFYTIDSAEHNRALAVFAYIDEGSEGFVFSNQGQPFAPNTYSYRVSAVNSLGIGPPSNIASITI